MAAAISGLIMLSGTVVGETQFKPEAAAFSAPEAILDATGLTIGYFDPSAKAGELMKVTITGPDGQFLVNSVVPADSFSFLPDAGDGEYTFDAYILTMDTASGSGRRMETGTGLGPGLSESVPSSDANAKAALQESTEAQEDSTPLLRTHGSFKVYNGLIVQPDHHNESNGQELSANSGIAVEHARPKAATGDDLSLAEPGLIEGMVGNLLNAIIPAAKAQNVTASSTTPLVRFEDTTDAAGCCEWWFEGPGQDNAGGLNEGTFVLSDRLGNNAHDVITVDGVENTTGNQGSINISTAGDVGLSDDVFWFEGSGNNMGISTTNPAVDIHMVDLDPQIRLEDSSDSTRVQFQYNSPDLLIQGNSSQGIVGIDATSPANTLIIEPPSTFCANGCIGIGETAPVRPLHITNDDATIFLEQSGTQRWQIGSADFASPVGSFFINEHSAGTTPFQIDPGAGSNALRIVSGGNVGVGTSSPTVPLHVQRTNGTAKLIVEEASGTVAAREMFELANNGGPFFIFKDNNLAQSYSFAMGATGHFLISHQQTAGVQFRLRQDGSAEFQGNVTANGVLLTSSRETKTDFSPIDEHTVLEKVGALDVSQWRYKAEPGSERHIGPMAEDFQALFGLGDGRHISAGDAQGILFAAAKALKAETSRLEAENEALKARVAELSEMEHRLKALEHQLMRISE